MGEQNLWDIFLEKEVENLNEIILRYGVNGLMNEFEVWLYKADLIDRKMEKEFRKAV